MKKLPLIIAILTLWISHFANAQSQEIYSFSSPTQQLQFEQLTQQLRCLVCQNESLADSNAPLAQDLRNEIYHKVQQGENSSAIKNYLLARYGQFILFKPALNRLTYALWIGPFVLLVIAIIILALLILRSKKTVPAVALSAREKQRLKDLGL